MSAVDVASLVPLQQIDLKIHDLKRTLDGEPIVLEHAREREAAKRAEAEAVAEKIKALKLDAAREEGKIQTIDAEIKKYEDQVRLVKKNDEYQILMKEISAKRADKGVIEDALLEIWTVVEYEEGLKKARAAELAEIEKETEALRRRIEADLDRVRRELEEELSRRGSLKPVLSGELVALYERTQVSKNDGRGLAPMVPVHEGGRGPESFICGGCSMNITLQDANSVFVASQAMLCRNCARLLYVDRS